jgi:hypothetical protein
VGDKVVAIVHQRGRSKRSGMLVEGSLPMSGRSARPGEREWRCIPTRARPSRLSDWSRSRCAPTSTPCARSTRTGKLET